MNISTHIKSRAICQLSRGLLKSAAGEFSIENILNRICEEYGIEQENQNRILEALKKQFFGAKSISRQNAEFVEGVNATAMNKLLNTPGHVIHPTLRKSKKLLPFAAVAVGVPAALGTAYSYLKNKTQE